jgi:hypothetical protein
MDRCSGKRRAGKIRWCQEGEEGFRYRADSRFVSGAAQKPLPRTLPHVPVVWETGIERP